MYVCIWTFIFVGKQECRSLKNVTGTFLAQLRLKTSRPLNEGITLSTPHISNQLAMINDNTTSNVGWNSQTEKKDDRGGDSKEVLYSDIIMHMTTGNKNLSAHFCTTDNVVYQFYVLIFSLEGGESSHSAFDAARSLHQMIQKHAKPMTAHTSPWPFRPLFHFLHTLYDLRLFDRSRVRDDQTRHN